MRIFESGAERERGGGVVPEGHLYLTNAHEQTGRGHGGERLFCAQSGESFLKATGGHEALAERFMHTGQGWIGSDDALVFRDGALLLLHGEEGISDDLVGAVGVGRSAEDGLECILCPGFPALRLLVEGFLLFCVGLKSFRRGPCFW